MTNIKEASDHDLIAFLQNDELDAFKEIYQRYWKRMYSAAYKRLKNNEIAEEIVQELFVNLWAKRKKLSADISLNNYLGSSVSHSIIDRYRKEQVRQRYREAFRASYNDAGNSTEEAFNLKELSYAIEKEVLQLPDKCRSVYELSRKQFKSNKEIALHLGISEKTVENHLTKALKRLRVSLGQFLLLLCILFF